MQDELVIAIDRRIEGSEDVNRSECRIPLEQVPPMTQEMFDQIIGELKLRLNTKTE